MRLFYFYNFKDTFFKIKSGCLLLVDLIEAFKKPWFDCSVRCFAAALFYTIYKLENKPSSSFSIALKYIRHVVSSGNSRGHRIHSPFIYQFVRKVLFNDDRIAAPIEVRKFYRKLREDKSVLNIKDFGAGSRITDAHVRTVSSIARHSSITRCQGDFLYRLCLWYKPSRVVEFGTGLGISTAFISSGAENANITTIEGSPEKHHFASANVPSGAAGSIEFLMGHFDDHFGEVLESLENRTMVFLDGDHTYESTMKRTSQILEANDFEEMMVVMDDIYWSEGMEKAWKELVKSVEGAFFIDLFHFGIIFMRKDISSQYFRLRLI